LACLRFAVPLIAHLVDFGHNHFVQREIIMELTRGALVEPLAAKVADVLADEPPAVQAMTLMLALVRVLNDPDNQGEVAWLQQQMPALEKLLKSR
jgi:dihydroneopterin aldolase